jgi:hypothetical protein
MNWADLITTESHRFFLSGFEVSCFWIRASFRGGLWQIDSNQWRLARHDTAFARPSELHSRIVAARSGSFDLLGKSWSRRTRAAMQALQNYYTGSI